MLFGGILFAAGFVTLHAYSTLKSRQGRDGRWLDNPERRSRWRAASYVGSGLFIVGFLVVILTALVGQQLGLDFPFS